MGIDLFQEDNVKKYSEGLGAITFISESYFELSDIFNKIKKSEFYRFNVGKPQLISLDDTLVLSVSSILFFENYNLLYKLKENFTIHILKSTIDYFLDEEEYICYKLNEEYKRLEKIDLNRKKTVETKIKEYNKKIKRLEIILDWLKSCKIIEVYGAYEPKYDIEDNSASYIDELFIYADLDTATYASRMGYTILVDDYVTSEIFRDLFNIKREKISNMAGFINTIYIDNLKEYFSIIKKLVDSKYNYVIDKSSLLKLTCKISDKDYKYLDDIIKLLAKRDVNGYYKMLIEDTLQLDLTSKN